MEATCFGGKFPCAYVVSVIAEGLAPQNDKGWAPLRGSYQG